MNSLYGKPTVEARVTTGASRLRYATVNDFREQTTVLQSNTADKYIIMVYIS